MHMTNLKNFFSPGRPSRACPHRFCRPLHSTFLTLTGLGLLAMLAGPILFSLSMILLTICLVWLIAILLRGGNDSVHGNTSTHAAPLAPAGKILAASNDHGPLAHWYGIRTGWARAAAAMDALFVLMSIIFVVGSVEKIGRFTEEPEGGFDWSPVVAILVGIGLAAFRVYAHYKATAPTRPAAEWSWWGRLAPQVG
jgi:hypothetical protein